jgi:hypothetical protein
LIKVDINRNCSSIQMSLDGNGGKCSTRLHDGGRGEKVSRR